ncbi:MAG: hypothetical protein WCO42_04165 [bacterium]
MTATTQEAITTIQANRYTKIQKFIGIRNNTESPANELPFADDHP